MEFVTPVTPDGSVNFFFKIWVCKIFDKFHVCGGATSIAMTKFGPIGNNSFRYEPSSGTHGR